MTNKYELCVSELGGEYIKWDDNGIIRFIPIDPANSDYQAYLDRDKPKAALSTPIVSSDADQLQRLASI